MMYRYIPDADEVLNLQHIGELVAGKPMCFGCRFFAKERRGEVDHGLGQCRAKSPAVGTGWPVVIGIDWCGEFSRNF